MQLDLHVEAYIKNERFKCVFERDSMYFVTERNNLSE